MGDLWARSPDGRHTWLYVLVVKYTYDSSVQALDSPGAADDARRQGAGLSLNTQLVVNLLSKGLWVGRTLLVTNAATQKKRVFTRPHALLGTGPLAVVRLSLKQHLRENNNWSTTTRQ